MGYLRVKNLGKSYKQYAHKWSRLAEWLSLGKVQRHESHWVLKGINFDVKPGEAVGIIGKNGAGKSTLLKIIAGTTKPTEGDIEVGGRVAALLELGIGFHPDFTGRENVYMSGQLLGFSRKQITAAMPGIEAFAEIGSYIDQPFRIYSSGMQMRLAFSAVTAYRPDILIVDEALAVGDLYFQQKCFERIRTYRDLGSTLLFVSHDLNAVYKLCNRVLLLDGGHLIRDGIPKEVIDLYQALLQKSWDSDPSSVEVVGDVRQPAVEERRLEPRIGTIQKNSVRVHYVKVLLDDLTESSIVLSESDVYLSVKIVFLKEFEDPHVGFRIRDKFGGELFGTNTYCMKQTIGRVTRGTEIIVNFRFNANFFPGQYSVSLGVVNGGMPGGAFKETLVFIHDAAVLEVLHNPDSIQWSGNFNLRPSFSCRVLATKPALGRTLNSLDVETVKFSIGTRCYLLKGNRRDVSIVKVIQSNGGVWETNVSYIIQKILDPDSVCLDIGANIGVTSLAMSCFAPSGHIYAFEAGKENFSFLEENILENDARNITALNLGVLDATRRLKLCFIEELAGCSFISFEDDKNAAEDKIRSVVTGEWIRDSELHLRLDSVNCTSLDQWIEEYSLTRLDLIKMDIEGAEFFALQGAAHTLQRFRPRVVLEFNPKCMQNYFKSNPEELFDFLMKIFREVCLIEKDGSLTALPNYPSLTHKLQGEKDWADLYCAF